MSLQLWEWFKIDLYVSISFFVSFFVSYLIVNSFSFSVEYEPSPDEFSPDNVEEEPSEYSWNRKVLWAKFRNACLESWKTFYKFLN